MPSPGEARLSKLIKMRCMFLGIVIFEGAAWPTKSYLMARKKEMEPDHVDWTYVLPLKDIFSILKKG